ncbi:phage tail protein [Komagataeibacter nataicola]|uniref:Phage tail protein n=1 Tax=Komagataeibacter nataicola TaxID=265960 RepID=A0A9N7H1R1_9PROT|nr:phage tail protein [Komagataeibacter nataicola]AQU87962.1 phage tail protein [Komagataeibacter nataicola]PYD66490.1 phage tail protein [Komagataeibacter nataicola]WNM09446.1 phage tail protein [Komagataeibacter nataicola]GBR26712.1 bacteriophage tail protein [Komagataeibacter nataicola NRIC 0616]
MSGALSAVSDFLGWNNSPSDEVSIVVKSGSTARQITNWTSAVLRLGIEIMPWTASLGMTSARASAVGASSLNPGDTCQVYIGSVLVFTGYVITVVEDIGPEDHMIEVQIASKSVDLVECAAEFSTFQMNSTNALAIARKVCQFAGIDVISINGAGNTDILAFSVILTETAYEVIERLSRLAAVLFYDRPDGNICMSGVGTSRAASGFVLGQNIEHLQTVRSLGGRYSKVTAVCQGTVSLFTDPNENALDSQMGVLTVGVEATDPGVPRIRNMLIPVENGDQDYAVTRQRVQWEVNRRIGRAYPISLTCDSWRDQAGQIWLPNTLAPVTAADGMQQDMLIGELTLRQTVDDGTHADVVLMPPAAYSPEPLLNPVLADKFIQALTSDQNSTDGSIQTEDLPPQDTAS